MQNLTIAQLNSRYLEGETCDHELFSEQRSNILLVTGNHYNKKKPRYLERIRDTNQLSNEAKLRITKNHLKRITSIYVNNIINAAPMVGIFPKNESEASDRKSAEMHKSVWEDIKIKHKMKQKIYEYVSDFVEIGECFVKATWDGNKGKSIPVEQTIDPISGDILEQVNLMSGDLEYERIYGFNLLRDPAGKSFEDCRWVIHRKMVDFKELKLKYMAEPEKLSFVEESAKDTFVVFNGQSGTYDAIKNKVMVREYFFRPCTSYPNGYFYITTEKGILEEGELPLGKFPIIACGFDRIPTSPRFQSVIKQLRPYQAEINRSASKIAEHQVTLGDDKVFIQAGTKLGNGGTIAGIRGVQYTGVKPEILEGRNGAQYLEYMMSQIDEMYRVASIQELSEEKVAQVDPYALLFRSMRDKKAFSTYAEKFESFLNELCELSLRLVKFHAPEQMIINMVGKNDRVNMPEFKAMDDLGYQIRIEPRSDDIESLMGKQLSLNHVLQYASAQLTPEMIGQVLKNMPYINKEQITTDFTIDYDNAENVILALDRGEWVAPELSDNNEYMLKRLNHRKKQASYKFLSDQIKQAYEQNIQLRSQIIAQQQAEVQAAAAGYIPTGGYLVGVDFYVNFDPANPQKTRRARIPFEALDWLMKRLNQQGMSQENIQQMDLSMQAQIASQGQQQMNQSQTGQQMPVEEMGYSPQSYQQ